MASKLKILLVEDDHNLGFVTKDRLEDSGFEVVLAKDGVEGYKDFMQQQFDLCIFDIMLPKKDGFELARDVRQANKNVPIIFLTAKSMMEDKIKGFKSGADDFITKPFEIEELILRVEAILKRSKAPEEGKKKGIFKIGKYTFDHKNLELKIEDKIKTLTKKEAELLRLLCLNTGNVLEREVALNIVWGNDDYFLGRSMDVFITKLRKYLSEDKHIKIMNVHGVGFKMEVESPPTPSEGVRSLSDRRGE